MISIKSTESTFYLCLRPLAILCKILGSFSLINVFQKEGRLLRHRWISFHVFIGICSQILLSFSAAFMLQLEYRKFTAVYYIIPKLLVIFTCYYHDQYIPQLITAIETFDSKLANKLRGKYLPNPNIQGVVWLTFGVSFVVCLAAGFDFNRIETHSYVCNILLDLVLTVPRVTRHLNILIFTCFCYNLRLRFLLIDRLLEQSLTVEVGKCPRRQEELLEEVRLFHAKLSGIVNIANKCFGNLATIFVSILCVNTLVELFIFCFISQSMAQLIFLLMDIFGVFFTTTVGGYLINTNNILLDRLIAIPLSRFSMACQLQVQMFMNQIIARPVHMSFSGFGVINRAALISIFMAIMTHFIVVIQFSTQLKDFSTTSMKAMNST